MTPREPDRFEAKARELWVKELLFARPEKDAIAVLAAALRRERDDALGRAAQIARGVYLGNLSSKEGVRSEIALQIERALASPAAAPAAEVKVNACQVDLRTDKDRECFDDIVQAATRVLRSEPVAPFLLPRVLAALESSARNVHNPITEIALAAELRRYIAEQKECLICHERPVANAPDAAACGVCMLADLRRIMDERRAAEKRIKELERRVEAGLRIAKYSYRFWSSSGGDPECAHGINLGIYCARCDMNTLETGAERTQPRTAEISTKENAHGSKDAT